MRTRRTTGTDKSREKKMEKDWTEREGKWGRAWMREMGGGKPEKRRRADVGRVRERTRSFTISQQLGLAVMGTQEQQC